MAVSETAERILAAARECLLADGFAAMSTRKVAAEAGVPLSQVHYHFGSKEELILAVLRGENERLLERQSHMFRQSLPVWRRWEIACDFFDQDLESGYVRVLQEMVAGGWSSEAIRAEVSAMLMGWFDALMELARSADDAGLSFGKFTHEDTVALVGAAFMGAESMILLGIEGPRVPLRRALRRVGETIRLAEESR